MCLDKRLVSGTIVLAMLICAGCTQVQKGAAAGGGLGGSVGAVWGHATATGGVPGALIGVGVGSVTGALAADHYYEPDVTEVNAPSAGELAAMEGNLHASKAQVQELRGALEREKAQQTALLEAQQKARQELDEFKARFGENMVVQRNSEGVTLTILSEVLFNSGKAKLTAKGKAALHEAASAIRQEFPDAELEIRGHTDNVPIRYSKYPSNRVLSFWRAYSVLDYLADVEGFRADKLVAVAYGSIRPVSSNDTPEGRRRNRRAEIVIKPKGLTLAERN